jgi:hypothetical protein
VHSGGVSKLEQIEGELGNLSRTELEQLRDQLDEMLEDQLEFTPDFETAIQESECERAKGLRPRVRKS